MRNILMMWAVFAAALSLWGNVGVFRGGGQTPVLEKSAEVQMVEEEVVMRPRRGDFPVDDSLRNLDRMDFSCRFLLRNLADKPVKLSVGFPVSAEGVSSPVSGKAALKRFRFVARTKDRTFPVRFVPHDKKRKFSNIFLWEMSFAPKEEVTLFVTYTMEGYRGLAVTLKGQKFENRPYLDRYGEICILAVGQFQTYVTGTGSCWAGKIEKAVFRYYPFAFEEYLKKRGSSEESAGARKRRMEDIKKHPDDYSRRLGSQKRFFRVWTPAPDEWKLVPGKKRNEESYLELVRTPFTPAPGDKISIGYVFPLLPENIEDFEAWCRARKKSLGIMNKIPFTPALRRELADIILESCGIETGNPAIREYLKEQVWYPVKNPPPMDEAYKEYLQKFPRP
ncbi:MAG: hypothetical protein IJT50_00200 [Lentisphaeria bacterium]|nr:hypothetical protein [Lentisphaeria bacterium]